MVYLTQLGGGAFGNRADWIHAAMRRAFSSFHDVSLDVRVVSYGQPEQELTELIHARSARG